MDTEDPTRLVDRLMALWAAPPDPARFAELYHDPVVVNGTTLPLAGLLERSTRLQSALRRDGVDVLEVVATPDRVVVVFELHGVHVGTYPSAALGDLPGTGRPFRIRVIDVLTLREGRISALWMVADESSLVSGARH